MVSEDGNLLLLSGQKDIFWSSNVSNAAQNSSAQLLDSGNLVLQEQNQWEDHMGKFQVSFSQLLQKMELSKNI